MNEILFMEMRLINLYAMKHNMNSITVNKIFNENKIWEYIEECYDTLHMCGDEYILNDIEEMIKNNGVKV